MTGIEPHLALAFAMASAPGAYAVLLGAGASAGAGIPAAWEIQLDLLNKLAIAQGAQPDDPFAWYHQTYGTEASYDRLLDALTATRHERHQLLRRYFEADDSEREQGLKQPTAAHHAIARLVGDGRVRVVLTTNFDRLIETALRAIGLEPVVVSGPHDIPGLAPLHTIGCLVVHLHGDYLQPDTMLNTATELTTYPPEVDRLLDRIIDEYGLIILGWSAKYDTALRTACSRCPTRRFASFWIDPHPLAEIATDLATRRAITVVTDTAEHFLTSVADAADAITQAGTRHPSTVHVAVSLTKRLLATQAHPIRAHDLLREELERVHHCETVTATTFDPLAGEYQRRLDVLIADSQVAVALVATLAYWGSPATDTWWLGDLETLSTQPHASGSTALINLTMAPATFLLYAAGTCALGAQRMDLVARLLTEPAATDANRGTMVPVAERDHPDITLVQPGNSTALFNILGPACQEHAGLGATGYLEAWERFLYLDLVSATLRRKRVGSGRGVGIPHMRVTDLASREYIPVPSTWFLRHIVTDDRLRALGDRIELVNAADDVDTQLTERAHRIATQRLPPGRGGVLPSGTWLLTESPPP